MNALLNLDFVLEIFVFIKINPIVRKCLQIEIFRSFHGAMAVTSLDKSGLMGPILGFSSLLDETLNL